MISDSSDENEEIEFVEVPEMKEDPFESIQEHDEGDNEIPPGYIEEHEPVGDQFSVLGAKPSEEEKQGNELHDEIVVRWLSYLRKGVKKEERTKVIERYPLPKNLQALLPPQVNGEVLGCIPEAANKNDRFLKSLQHQIGHGLTALGNVMHTLLAETKPSDHLTSLADAAMMFANVHNALSILRKQKILPYLNSDAKKVANASTLDESLFGANFGEALKANQSLKKTTGEIKKKTWYPPPGTAGTSGTSSFPRPIVPTRQTGPANQNAQTSHSLNYKRGAFRSRMKNRRGEQTQRGQPTQYQRNRT